MVNAPKLAALTVAATNALRPKFDPLDTTWSRKPQLARRATVLTVLPARSPARMLR
jgi:hypothetical protein